MHSYLAPALQSIWSPFLSKACPLFIYSNSCACCYCIIISLSTFCLNLTAFLLSVSLDVLKCDFSLINTILRRLFGFYEFYLLPFDFCLSLLFYSRLLSYSLSSLRSLGVNAFVLLFGMDRLFEFYSDCFLLPSSIPSPCFYFKLSNCGAIFWLLDIG